jgi:hypothetical protein
MRFLGKDLKIGNMTSIIMLFAEDQDTFRELENTI